MIYLKEEEKMSDVQQVAEWLYKELRPEFYDEVPDKHYIIEDIKKALRRFAANMCNEAVSEYYDDLNFDNPHFSLTAWLEAKAKELREMEEGGG
jgi:hypothetical protein